MYPIRQHHHLTPCPQEPNPYSIDSSPEDSSPIESSHEGSRQNDDIQSKNPPSPSSSGGNVSRFFQTNKDTTPARSAPAARDVINQNPEVGSP
mmetsp:Transcript_4419/g.9207  ORF Transcript_4419/g.9207 Transcript_4419/m.9207 type:complete len:93 (-) Transcript_4419:213-491(-)